jgi:hypothetical protein
MDSDDISLSHRFAAQVSFMDANPDVAVLGAWQKRFGREDDIHKAAAAHDDIKANLLFRSDMCHSVVMLRRKSLIDNELWYDPRYIFEDYELWTRAVHVVRFANMQEVLGLYRKHEGGLYDRQLMEIIQEEQSIFARSLEKLGIDYYAYPRNLIHAHLDKLPMVFSAHTKNWAERLCLLRRFFDHILSRNKQFKVYDQECLRHSLKGRWLACLDINVDIMAEYNYDKFPFEYIITDILNEANRIAEGKDVCLFCLGKIGCRALPYFKDFFGERLRCVSDNDPSKWGRMFYGVVCVSPDSLPKDTCLFVTTANTIIANEVFAQFKGLGLDNAHLYSDLSNDIGSDVE